MQRVSTPSVVFVTERHHLAHTLTGRSRETGECKIAVAVRRRRNGLVHFDADLFRLDCNLRQDAIRRLYRYWHDLNADYSLPKRILRRMSCHFGKTTIIFDATAQEVEEWRDFLMAVLTDSGSYVDCPARTLTFRSPAWRASIV